MNNRMLKGISFFAIIVLFIGITISQSAGINIEYYSFSLLNGNTFYVGGSGHNNYTKIQDAIDDASNGDTVFVYDDSSPYYENIILDKSINLIGEDKETTVIDANGLEDVVRIIAGGATITGFSIENGGSSNNIAGIKVRSNYSIISNNYISTNYHGILLEYSTNNNISNNKIVDNIAYGIITTEHSNFNNVSSNYIVSNNNAGICIGGDCNNNSIRNNKIYENNDGIIICDLGNFISGNIINHSRIGIWLSIAANNVVFKNNVVNSTDIGIFCQDQSNFNNISRNNISGNSIGLRIQNKCYYNIISGNNFNSNSINGLQIDIAPFPNNYNIVYHNNFINNVVNAIDLCNNTWDDGYPSGGNYWDDYNGEDNNGDDIGDTPYVVPGVGNQDNYPLMEPWPKVIIPVPDLDCDGSLSWTDIEPGATVHGSFTVQNIGEADSILDWEVYSFPSWGNWTFTPETGECPAPEGGPVTVNVTVVAPDEQNEEFSGSVRIVNKENSSDYCKIDVSLSTPKNKAYYFNFNLLGWLFERFSNAFSLVRYLLGL